MNEALIYGTRKSVNAPALSSIAFMDSGCTAPCCEVCELIFWGALSELRYDIEHYIRLVC